MAAAAGEGHRLRQPVVQQHAVRQIGEGSRAAPDRRPGGTSLRASPTIFEDHHRAEPRVSCPVVDRRGGAFDGRPDPRRGGRAGNSVSDRQFYRAEWPGPSGFRAGSRVPPSIIWNTSSSGRPAAPPDATRLVMRSATRVYDMSPLPGRSCAHYRVADRVERDIRASLPFEEQRLFLPPFARHESGLSARGNVVTVETVLPLVVLRATLNSAWSGDGSTDRGTDHEDRYACARPPRLDRGRRRPAARRQADTEQDCGDLLRSRSRPCDEALRLLDDE